MDFLNLLKGQLGDGVFQQISQQIGSDDSKKTEKAATETVNAMMTSLQKQASTEQGAQQLNQQLEQQQGGGGMLQNLTSMFGGGLGNLGAMFGGGGNNNEQKQQEQAVNGIFGNEQQQQVQQISQNSGLSPDIISKLMGFLAPLVMGFLGTAKQQQGVNAGNMAQFLQSQQQHQNKDSQQQNPPATEQKNSGVMGFLDQNGDGNVGMDDVSGFFKKLF